MRELDSLEIKFKCRDYNRNHNHRNAFIQDWAPTVVTVHIPRVVAVQVRRTIVATIDPAPHTA